MKELPIPLARCAMRYEDMTPLSARSRFCERCREPVHDLSAMPLVEARRLLREERARCVRYRFDARGQVVHPPSRGARAAAVAALLVAPFLMEACGGAPRGWDYNPVPGRADEGDGRSSEAEGEAEEKEGRRLRNGAGPGTDG